MVGLGGAARRGHETGGLARAGARVRARARVTGLRVFRVAHVVQLAVDSNGGVAVAQLTEGVKVLALPRLLTERAHLLVRVRARARDYG